MGNHRQPAVLCLHFLCSYSYFYPLDMILIVRCRPQQLNSLVRPLQSRLLCFSLGRRGQLTLPVSPFLSEILALQFFGIMLIDFLVDGLICSST